MRLTDMTEEQLWADGIIRPKRGGSRLRVGRLYHLPDVGTVECLSTDAQGALVQPTAQTLVDDIPGREPFLARGKKRRVANSAVLREVTTDAAP